MTLKILREKFCEIKGGGQEMTAIALIFIMHNFTAWLFLCGFHFFLYFIRPQNQPMADFEVCFYSHFFFSMQTQ